MTRFDVVGLGENSVDLVYRLPEAPSEGGKVQASAHRVLCGGQVATTLATCASLGLRTAYLGAFGSDDGATRIREALTQRGIDISHAPVRQASNRHAVILVDERHGDRTVVWQRDSRLALTPDEVPAALVAGARLVHVDDLDEEASLAAARLAAKAGIPVTGDIDRVTDQTRMLVDAISTPILSSHVLAALTGEPDPERGLRALRQRHAGWLSVTLGTGGAMLLEADRLHHAPACPVEAIDTTGAGDVFRGAFIYALLRGERPRDVLRFAVTAAALSCTREGALDSVPTLDEVERRLEE